MKILSFLLFVLMTLSPLSGARAQSQEDSISLLLVSLWPDYDRHSVLVIMSGTLPSDVSLPAVVTLPFPESGQLGAVARVTDNGPMIDGIEYSRSPGEIEITTPDPRFRLEYYYPYREDGKERAFTFRWLSALSVERLGVAVQQPIGAEAIAMTPAAIKVEALQHGLNNHLLPSRAVPAGQEYTVEVSYGMPAPLLSVEAFPPKSDMRTAAPPSASPAPPAPEAPTVSRWDILIGVIGIAFVTFAIFWQVGRRRAGGGEVSRPSQQSSGDEKVVRFCHNCGGPVQPQHNFCGGCGMKFA